MDVLIYLVPFTILFSLIGLYALIWSIKNNQYDDMKGAAERILFDTEEEDKDKSIARSKKQK